MSDRLENMQLLISGYIKEQSEDNIIIPKELIHYIQCFYTLGFYDKWIHSEIISEELQQFANAKKPIITQTIKGITFSLMFTPIKNENISKFIVGAHCVTNIPSNIEYIEVLHRVDEPSINISNTPYYIETFDLKQSKQNTRGFCTFDLSRLSVYKTIHWIVSVRCIIYKNNCNKLNYYHPSYYIRKYTSSTQIVSGEYRKISQHWFGNNRFRAFIFGHEGICENDAVNGPSPVTYATISIKFLRFPYKIKSIHTKMRVIVRDGLNMDIEPYYIKERIWNFEKEIVDYMCLFQFMPFDEFRQKIKLLICIELEIMKIYDTNDKIIDENEWEKYGIIINKQIIENKLNIESKEKELVLLLYDKNKQIEQLKDALNEILKSMANIVKESNDRINVLMKEKQFLLNEKIETDKTINFI
eukprot:402354_1